MGLFFTKSKPEQKTLPALDSGRICALLQYFPVGMTVHYYPEFKNNIVLETVVIGYMVNNTPVFSAQELTCEGEGAAARFRIRHGKTTSHLTRMALIVPAQGRNLGHLDYVRREELERTGGLSAGNNITLMAQGRQGRLPLVQTTVAKKTLVKEGPFANTPVAILDADVDSLLLSDQRAHQRLHVQVPAHIHCDKSAPVACIMADFTERSVRLRGGDHGWPAHVVAGCRLVLAFRLSGRDRDTLLRGEVYRVDFNDLVLILEDIQRDGQFRRMDVIDILEIKSKLLQLPETRSGNSD